MCAICKYCLDGILFNALSLKIPCARCCCISYLKIVIDFSYTYIVFPHIHMYNINKLYVCFAHTRDKLPETT